MKRVLGMVLLIASVVGGASAVSGQTISPTLAEFGKKASGSFTIESHALIPMSVTLEIYSFSIDKTGKHLRPLDSTTHVKLSETSARLSPKEVHEFAYQITCDTLPVPCEVSILSGMIVGRTQGGKDHPVMQIRLILDHAVYVCEKQKNCRKNILEASGYKPTAPVTTPNAVKSVNLSATQQ